MTVKELIRQLETMDENKIVHIYLYTQWDKHGPSGYEQVKNVAEYEDIVEILPFNHS